MRITTRQLRQIIREEAHKITSPAKRLFAPKRTRRISESRASVKQARKDLKQGASIWSMSVAWNEEEGEIEYIDQNKAAEASRLIQQAIYVVTEEDYEDGYDALADAFDSTGIQCSDEVFEALVSELDGV